MSRIVQFFEDGDHQLSMTRLLCFMSFFPAVYVVIKTCSSDTLGWFLGAYATAYVGGKISDRMGKGGKQDVPDSNT